MCSYDGDCSSLIRLEGKGQVARNKSAELEVVAISKEKKGKKLKHAD